MVGTKLSPEQTRAFVVFQQAFARWKDYYLTEEVLTVDTIRLQDTKFFTHIQLKTKTLPRGGDWLWNQSRSRQHVTTDDGTQIVFYKLNTRKVRKVEGESPPYKIWIFNIRFIDCQTLSFLWCERGEQNEIMLEISPVSLEDLSFLSPFASETCSKMFGWQ